MKIEGYGGRAGNSQFSERVVDGLLSTDEKPAGLNERRCANPKCQRLFYSRQDGDNFCTEKCDSQFRGKGSADLQRSGNDPSWENGVRMIEG